MTIFVTKGDLPLTASQLENVRRSTSIVAGLSKPVRVHPPS